MRESKEEDNPEIPMPEDLKQGKDRMIFGNLENIYEWHREYVIFISPMGTPGGVGVWLTKFDFFSKCF